MRRNHETAAVSGSVSRREYNRPLGIARVVATFVLLALLLFMARPHPVAIAGLAVQVWTRQLGEDVLEGADALAEAGFKVAVDDCAAATAPTTATATSGAGSRGRS